MHTPHRASDRRAIEAESAQLAEQGDSGGSTSRHDGRCYGIVHPEHPFFALLGVMSRETVHSRHGSRC